MGTWADQPLTPDLIRAVAAAAAETRSLMGNLTEMQIQQVNLLVERLAAGNPLAGTMLDFVSAVLVCCGQDTRISASASADDPATWRM